MKQKNVNDTADCVGKHLQSQNLGCLGNVVASHRPICDTDWNPVLKKNDKSIRW
jgi:hypothetical protein